MNEDPSIELKPEVPELPLAKTGTSMAITMGSEWAVNNKGMCGYVDSVSAHLFVISKLFVICLLYSHKVSSGQIKGIGTVCM